MEPTSPVTPSGVERTLVGASSTDVFAGAPVGSRGTVGGINNLGQATGSVIGLTSQLLDFAPYRWTPGSGLVTLTGFCCVTQYGTDINDAGTVVGFTQTNQNDGLRAFRAAGTTMTLLGLLPGTNSEGNSRALAINATGQIAGNSTTPAFGTHAVLWSPANVIQDLGTLGGSNSSAIDINASGQVVGTSLISGNAATHFFLWSSGAGMQDLTTQLGALTNVIGINDAGQIAGTFANSAGASHAFLYTPGSGLRDLGTLGGTSSTATGLNNLGQVVGNSTLADGTTHDFLWTPSDGLEDVTAITGITGSRLLNDKLQTVTGPTIFDFSGKPIRVIKLDVVPNAAPVARFTWSCVALTCSFDATTSSDDKAVVAYSWNLGEYRDGTAAGATVAGEYPHAGTREVTLTVTDANGLTSSVSRTIVVP